MLFVVYLAAEADDFPFPHGPSAPSAEDSKFAATTAVHFHIAWTHACTCPRHSSKQALLQSPRLGCMPFCLCLPPACPWRTFCPLPDLGTVPPGRGYHAALPWLVAFGCLPPPSLFVPNAFHHHNYKTPPHALPVPIYQWTITIQHTTRHLRCCIPWRCSDGEKGGTNVLPDLGLHLFVPTLPVLRSVALQNVPAWSNCAPSCSWMDVIPVKTGSVRRHMARLRPRGDCLLPTPPTPCGTAGGTILGPLPTPLQPQRVRLPAAPTLLLYYLPLPASTRACLYGLRANACARTQTAGGAPLTYFALRY